MPPENLTRAINSPTPGPGPGGGERPTLLLDCDGVLYQIEQFVLNVINQELGTSFTVEHITDWDWRLCLGEQAAAIFERLVQEPDCWHRGEPFPGVVADTQRLAEHYTLVVATAMWPEHAALREAWLARQGIPVLRCIVGEDKVAAARSVGAVAAIEDNAPNASALARAGVRSYLVERPYNRNVPVDPRVIRTTWQAAVAELLALPSHALRP